MLKYHALGIVHEISLDPLEGVLEGPHALAMASGGLDTDSQPAIERFPFSAERLKQSSVLRTRIGDSNSLAIVRGSVAARPLTGRRNGKQTAFSTAQTITIATETVIAEGLRHDDFAAARDFGAQIVEEALDGKVLFRLESIERAFGLIDLLEKRQVGSVSPNFLRRVGGRAGSANLNTA